MQEFFPTHDDGKHDTRYSYRKEFCGHEVPRYVARFCGDLIAITNDADEASRCMHEHQSVRFRKIEEQKSPVKIDTDLTRFDGFEVYPVRQIDELKDGSPIYEQIDELIDGEPQGGCDFWTVYGHYDPTDYEAGVSFANVGIEALIDCHTRKDAERLAVYFAEMRDLQLARNK